MSTVSPTNVNSPTAPVSRCERAASGGSFTSFSRRRDRDDPDVDAGQMGLIAEYIKGARTDRR